jgi:DeoR family transcriptional regulator, fructose operon transcriptional repressor
MSADELNRENTLPAKRHLELVELIRARGQMTVNELSNRFGVSGDTVRRDLDFLANQGLVKRTHGGAVAMDNLVQQDSTFMQRMNTRVPAKERIARAACQLITDGETLLLNGGSTTRFFAVELSARRNLTIVTNNLTIPAALAPESIRDIYVLGGQYKGDAQVTVGPVGFVSAASIKVDSAVIGVGGISVEDGLSTTVLEEASMILAMINAARRTIVLADASKLGHSSFAQIVPLDRIDILVTDEAPSDDLARAFREAGVELMVAKGE